jgi:hypothetical protein
VNNVSAGGTKLDFEDLPAHTIVKEQYAHHGVVFPSQAVVTVGQPAANSGTRVLKAVAPKVHYKGPFVIQFNTGQSRVRLLAGAADDTAKVDITGTLRAYDAEGVLVGHDGPKSVTPNVCSTAFEIHTPTPVIRRLALFELATTPGGEKYEEVEAIDDLEFEGLPPPPLALKAMAPLRTRVEERPNSPQVAKDPASQGRPFEPLALKPKETPPEFRGRGSFEAAKAMKWTSVPDFDLRPKESRQIKVPCDQPVLLLARANWSGTNGSLAMRVAEDKTELASGQRFSVPPDRGTVTARVEIKKESEVTVTMVNEGSGTVKVQAVVGTLVPNAGRKNP